MPDDKDSKDTSTQDPVKNMKAEMDRKLGNVEGAITKLTETNSALAAQLERLSKQVPDANIRTNPAPTKSWSERFYEDEAGTLMAVKEEAKREALEAARSMHAIESQKNAALSQMVNDYPELTDAGSDLRKKAVEVFNSMSKEDQASPSALKLAVREAAADLAVLPKSKRKDTVIEDNDDDTFALSGGGSGKTSGDRKRKEGKLSEATLTFAELLGRPVTDEKYLERLKKASERSNWSKYKKVEKA